MSDAHDFTRIVSATMFSSFDWVVFCLYALWSFVQNWTAEEKSTSPHLCDLLCTRENHHYLSWHILCVRICPGWRFKVFSGFSWSLALATFHRFSVPLLVVLLFLFIPVVIISWPRCLQSCSSFAVFIISAHPLLFPSDFSNLTSKLHHSSPIKLWFSLTVLL